MSGLALALQVAHGCGGSEFAGDATGGGSAGLPQSAGSRNDSAGASGGGSVLNGCHGPEDCSDGDPCTQEVCRDDGICELVPKCEADQKCCQGDCSECCESADCDDGIACTKDICFASVCQHQPSSTSCGAGLYCSLDDDCVSQEACNGSSADCDDGSNCTVDSCEGALCVHAFCDAATRCCPETGCADQCCSDQECDSDDDPCTTGVCTAGKCSQTPRCGDGEKCCASPDGGASCGSCCAASDCADNVVCTVDACIEGRCFNAVGGCDPGYTCDPVSGCKKDVECLEDAQCASEGCGHCDDGTCSYGCGAGQVCCNNSCQGCCNADDCFDGIDCTDNACIEGTCQFTPNNKLCPLLQTCNVVRRGCVLL